MRSLATLLVLLLALPGLVLPAGFLWRICRCAAAASTAAATPSAASATACCCAAHQAVTPAPLPSTCCDHCCRGEKRSDHGAVLVTPRSCKCVWVKVPDHQPKPLLPQQPPSSDVIALPPTSAGVVPVLADTGRRLQRFEVARPPPRDHHRNLPLLL
ncbi:MAG TPA: hypothetical protein VFD82_20155 [Planctomycetota bacterium]|nr:hypothetical protein [Planctomycetota bacterium]